MTTVWQASDALDHFSDLMAAAVDGEPQLIRREDGREVVVLSREDFERTHPTLKSYLLTAGFAENDDDDAFDRAMADIRREGSPFVASGNATRGE